MNPVVPNIQKYRVNAELQENYANVQEKRAQNATQRLNISFKGINSSLHIDDREIDEDIE